MKFIRSPENGEYLSRMIIEDIPESHIRKKENGKYRLILNGEEISKGIDYGVYRAKQKRNEAFEYEVNEI